MEKELNELSKMVARIDERTALMLEKQGKNAQDLEDHEARDRSDFKDVHTRINKNEIYTSKVERKQYWMLGIGSGIGAIVIASAKNIPEFFKGFFGG